MIKVNLREKKISKGRKTLYLDFYPPIPHPLTGKPTRHFTLKLYIYSRPKNSTEKTLNEETKILAENIRARRQLDVQAGAYDFLVKSSERDFLAFFESATQDEKKSPSVRSLRRASFRHFKTYCDGECAASHLTEKFIEGFKSYLLESHLTQNAAADYFNHFKTIYSEARRAGLVGHLEIKSISKIETHREFLSYEELNKLYATPFDECPNVRRAALFSALTGMRYCDIEKLLWEELRHSDETGHYVKFRQKKTGRAENLPISDDARSLLLPNDSKQVFPALPYMLVYEQLPVWLAAAGIKRHVTFHAFRHTFATLQLTLGEDILTVSKMLGHTTLRQTEKYTHIIDAKKRVAANRIKLTGETES